MDGAALALAARLVLAAALVFAAATKIAAPRRSRADTVALLGWGAGRLVALVLPYVELVIAFALVVWWSPVPGIVAFVVLVAFTVVLLRAQLRHLPCPCFGAVSAGAPVGGAAVLRNGVLAALAAIATGSPSGAPAVQVLVGLAGFGAVTVFVVVRAR